MNSVNSIFNSTNTAITDEGIININGGAINANSRGIYSSTNGNGILENVTVTSSGNPIYKYSGSSTLTVKDSHMMEGQIYNRSGTLKFEEGDVHIDVAFIGAPTSDEYGNARALGGKSDCGGLSYALADARYADKVVIITDTLESNSDYTCTAKAGIAAASGNTLASDYTISFRTRNTKTDNTMSTVLMFLMMGFMLFSTVRSAKKMAEEQAAKGSGKMPDDDKNTNPYKLAKAKNIPVEKAAAIIEKDKAKQAKKQAKYEEEKAKYAADYDEQVKKFEAEIRAEMEAERRANNFHVKKPASVRAAGGTIPRSVIKANKKKREARAKEAERAANKKPNKKK